jgi:hypothetical protein
MRWMVAAAILLALAGGANAANFDDPKALVTALYEPYTHGEQPGDLAGFYTDGLKALFAQRQQQAGLGNGIGSPPDPAAGREPQFDPFVNAKHYLLFDLAIGEPLVNGDRALVNVSYKNFDHPTVLSLSLAKGDAGWKIDDVASMGTDQHWMLSWLLAYDPLGTH